MATIIERIREFNAGRDAGKINYKYQAMTENIFRFYRGTCHIFSEDLANSNFPVCSPVTWITGDLHMENFGSYRSDNGLVYFDLNDFDEAILAPLHWEILRTVCSIYIALQSFDIDLKKAENLAILYLKNYAETLQSGKAVYIERQTADGIVCEFLQNAEQKKSSHLLKKKTERSKNKVNLLINGTRHVKLQKDFKKEIIQHVQQWLHHDDNSPYNYEVIDAAFRLAGTGSLGLERYVFLLQSLNGTGSKYMLLDLKEAAASSLRHYITVPQPVWCSEADRIIEIQKRMQNFSPALLSSTSFQGKDFIVEELQPESNSINFKLLGDRYKDMCRVIVDMARLTASAHIRSSGRQGSAIVDDLITFAAKEEWQQPVLEYAAKYALKVHDDFAEYCRALKSKVIPIPTSF